MEGVGGEVGEIEAKLRKTAEEVKEPERAEAERPVTREELLDLRKRTEELERGQKLLSSQVTEIATELEKKPDSEQIKAILRETLEEMSKASQEGAESPETQVAQAALALKSPLERFFGKPVSPTDLGNFLAGLGQFIQGIRGGAPAVSEEHPFYKAGETMFRVFSETFTRIYTREFGKATSRAIHRASHPVAEGKEKPKE